MALVSTPPAVDAADDLLPHARALLDADAEQLERSAGPPITCAPGCAACCSQPVPVTAAELRSIHEAIDALEPPRRHALRQRIAAVADHLADAGLGDALLPPPGDDRRELVLRYLRAGAPCPLLEDGRCSLRAVRPLACRDLLVTSDAAHCAHPEAGQVVRVRPRHGVIAGFARVSATLAEPERYVLAVALAAGAPPAPSNPAWSGPRLAQALRSV